MGASVIGGLSLLGDGLDIHNSSNYEEKGVSFNTCQNLKMALYFQINPISHLNCIIYWCPDAL